MTFSLQTLALVALRRLSIALSLILFSLSVGVSAVLFPPTTPIGLVAIPALLMLFIIPDLRAVPFRLARFFFFPFIFSSLCIPVYWAIILPGMPWISARRSLLFIFTGLTTLVIAGSSKHRQEIIQALKQFPFLTFTMVSYFITLVISLLQSVRIGLSTQDFINATLTSWIPFLATLMFVTRPQDVERLFRFLIYCTIVDFLIGGLEFALKKPFLIYALPGFMRNELVSQNSFYQALINSSGTRNGLYRAFSTYNTPLSWGELACMMAPISAYYLMHCKQTTSRFLGIFGFLACFLSIVFSGSRGGYIGFGVGLLVYFLVWAIRYTKCHPESLAGRFALILYSMMSTAVILSVFFVDRVRITVLGGGSAQASNEGRKLEWAAAMPKIWSRPLFGHGPATGAEVVGYYNQAGQATLDSYFINLLVDTGIIGCTLYVGMIAAAIILCIRRYLNIDSPYSAMSASAGCSLLAFLVYRSALSQNENATTMFILLAVTFVIGTDTYKRETYNAK